MPTTLCPPKPTRPTLSDSCHRSTFDQLMALGADINTNQYRAVHLAAQYDDEREWFTQGLKNAAFGIARQLDLHTSTASEWIRVGHSLAHLPQIDAAFSTNKISYAKARILTRWANTENEEQLLELAYGCTANRLTTAIAKTLAEDDPDDEARDLRHHQLQSVTSYTDGDGMIIIRIAVPPAIGKPVIAAVDVLVHEIANTPITEDSTTAAATTSNPRSSADDPNTQPQPVEPLSVKLAKIRQRWHPPKESRPRNPQPPMRRLPNNPTTTTRPQPAIRTNPPHHHNPTTTPMRTLPPSPPQNRRLTIQRQPGRIQNR